MKTEIHQHSVALLRLLKAYRKLGLAISEAFERFRKIYQKRSWFFIGKHSIEFGFLGESVHKFWYKPGVK